MKDSVNLDTLKIVNIIFSEHAKLYKENPLLKEKISALEQLNKSYEKSDSIKNIEINMCKERIKSDAEKISNLETFKKKAIQGFSAGGIVLFLLGLIIW